MSSTYVLDACAMLAVLSKETGAEKVLEYYGKAADGKISLLMNKLNLLEVYYNLIHAYGKEHADEFIDEFKKSPIIINHEITDEIFELAGRLKASYKISLADSIALAQAMDCNAALITADHHEFDILEGKENINFVWIR
jgi:predicted nucleic acid-binding protein